MSEPLPLEPGIVPDPSLGVDGDFGEAPADEPDEPTVINDEEEEEDDEDS